MQQQTPMMKILADIEVTVKVFGDNIPFVWAKLLLKVKDAIEEERQMVVDAFVSGEFKKYEEIKHGHNFLDAPNEYYNDKYNADITPTT